MTPLSRREVEDNPERAKPILCPSHRSLAVSGFASLTGDILYIVHFVFRGKWQAGCKNSKVQKKDIEGVLPHPNGQIAVLYQALKTSAQAQRGEWFAAATCADLQA